MSRLYQEKHIWGSQKDLADIDIFASEYKNDLIAQSVCRLSVPDPDDVNTEYVGTGFLAYIYRTDDAYKLYGLFTANHVIGAKELRSQLTIKCDFGSTVLTLPCPSQSYCMTCPNIDATFICLTDTNVIEDLNEKAQFIPFKIHGFSQFHPEVDKEVRVVQHPKGCAAKMAAEGNIIEVLDITFKHRASTEPGSSGAPIAVGNVVVGIHQSAPTDESKNYNNGTGMHRALSAVDHDALRTYLGVSTWSPKKLTPMPLGDDEIETLKSLGLTMLDSNGTLFKSPSPSIWLRRSPIRWCWHPTRPTEGMNYKTLYAGHSRSRVYGEAVDYKADLEKEGKYSEWNMSILQYVSSHSKGFFWK